MKRYKLGVAAMSHDHVWGELRAWSAMPNVDIVAAGDDEPRLLEKIQRQHNVSKLYSSYQEMIESEELDIVLAAGGNSEGADIVERCAAKGIHVVSEKPMAATLAQADRMLNAAKNAGTLLLINWPTAWIATWQDLERRVLAGEIGDVRYVRYRSAHGGPVAIGCEPEFVRDLTTPEINGAGAFMDYCCYGADLAARLLGEPLQVTGMRGYFGNEPAYAASDDNGVVVAKYAHAFAVCEASWTQPFGVAVTNPLVYGSKGAIGIAGNKILLKREGESEQQLDPPATEFPKRSAAEYLIYCLENSLPVEGYCSPEVSRTAQVILESGLRSADSGKAISLPLA
jgi:predicted dehydrogenase